MPTHHPRASGHAALRRGRFSLPGQTYLVTAATIGRQTLFYDYDGACAVARCHIRRDILRSTQLLAWVLMPDHAHWLVQLGEGDYLPAFVGRLKSASARAFHSACGGYGPIWARAYHDRVLRKGEDALTAARYIVMNPARAGLVQRVGDYPFWDAAWL